MNTLTGMKQSQLPPTTIPIKILCECGQKYAFDLESIDGGMAYPVQCPICGTDGTAAANRAIARHLESQTTSAPGLRLGEPPPPPTVHPPVPQKLPSAAKTGSSARTKPRTKRLVQKICGAVVLVLVAAAAVIFGRSHHGSSAVSNEDLPHTLVELNAWYVEPPAGQNAAIFFSQGFDALQIGNVNDPNTPLLGKGKLPPLGATMSVSVKSALAAALHANKNALQFFVQGAKCEQSRYPLDLKQGVDAVFPHLLKVKSATLVTELSAIQHAEANDGEQAANDVLTALGLARSLCAEPSLSSQKMRAASVLITLAALEQTLNRTALRPGSLSELSTAFHKMEDYDTRGEGFNRALAAELITSTALLATPQKLQELLSAPGVDIPAELRNQITARLQNANNLKEEQQYYQETFQQLRAVRKLALPDRLKAGDLIRQRVTKAADKKLAIIVWLLPGLAQDVAKEAGCLASLRLGLAALALEKFRAAHDNRYPDALGELIPDCLASTPMDPFDGQPLRYRKKGSGYLLYSIGPDLKDDSGQRMDGKNGDITFTVVKPAKRAE